MSIPEFQSWLGNLDRPCSTSWKAPAISHDNLYKASLHQVLPSLPWRHTVLIWTRPFYGATILHTVPTILGLGLELGLGLGLRFGLGLGELPAVLPVVNTGCLEVYAVYWSGSCVMLWNGSIFSASRPKNFLRSSSFEMSQRHLLQATAWLDEGPCVGVRS